MVKRDCKTRPLHRIAKDYFSYLGRHLPQQCASDEFYFLPRSETAIQNLDILDDMTPEKIRDHLQYVHRLLGEISKGKVFGLEEEIDRLLLKQSMKSFIRDFEDVKVWQSDPTLYVKIPVLATARIISQRDRTPGRINAQLQKLFPKIPPFLSLATKNLFSPSRTSLKVAIDMALDAIHFHLHDIPTFILEEMGENREIFEKNKEVLESWERYRKDLFQLPSKDSFAIGEDDLKEILAVSLSYPKPPDEILETAQYAYRETQEKLRTLARKIDSQKTWDLIIYEQEPSVTSPEETVQLYRQQVQDLRRFFYTQHLIPFPHAEKVLVLKTPSYLQSLRATASYSAPLTGDTASHGIFYITPGKEDLSLIASHCPYLSAHETYPGHHILDHLRIHHPNPIRRQIESPLFYEGWACYAEQLLDEFGYVRNPRQQLIGLKRRLWRSLRAELDVKLQTGRITLAQAAKKIEALGFSPQRAQRQVRRFALTPGYQLCYFMGNHEIVRLREKVPSKMGIEGFHERLLGGGEIPFHLVEKRVEQKRNESC